MADDAEKTELFNVQRMNKSILLSLAAKALKKNH